MSDENKEVVRRFNIEVIQNGSELAFHALISPDFINHAAPGDAAGSWKHVEHV